MRLRLETAESGKAALAAELARVQARLHDSLVRRCCGMVVGPLLPWAASKALPSMRLNCRMVPAALPHSFPPSIPQHSHDTQEVLEGLLGERSALMKQTRELQAQLAAALQGTPPRSAPGAARSHSAGTSPQPPTPERRLNQELLLAQVGGWLGPIYVRCRKTASLQTRVVGNGTTVSCNTHPS